MDGASDATVSRSAPKGYLWWAAALSFLLLVTALPDAVQGQELSASSLPAGFTAEPDSLPRSVVFVETGTAPSSFDYRSDDPWLGRDKFLHAGGSFLLTIGHQYVLVNKLNMTEHGALPLSMFGTSVLGVAKELYDWRFGPRSHFSERDLTANAVGILLAATIIVL